MINRICNSRSSKNNDVRIYLDQGDSFVNITNRGMRIYGYQGYKSCSKCQIESASGIIAQDRYAIGMQKKERVTIRVMKRCAARMVDRLAIEGIGGGGQADLIERSLSRRND